ncbi:MAG: energy-coupling factor transporter transmembrane component T [Anaerolineae bacterium]|nr:energy-coupling factor transporter transmembrane protein EcfT [Candidatus Roseilinea sp.]MDW8449336.1 energy-coupling factor transporter transmembrane component T [Anaerolineae bacterium]
MMQAIYVEGDSFLHRLNPLSKVMAVLPVMVFVTLATDPWTPLAISTLNVIVLLVLGRIPPGRLFKILALLALLMLIFLIVYPLVVRRELVQHTPLLFALGPIQVYQGGLLFGVAIALRVFCLIALSLPFSLTTDSSDFIRALVQQWRLPYRVGYSAMAALRFVPMLQIELWVIQAAHRVRGVSDKGGLRAQYDRLKRYTVPLLATAIRQAERTALAMDGRAFGAFETRTYFKRMAFARRDVAFVLGFWLACGLIVLALARAGLLGPLVLVQRV